MATSETQTLGLRHFTVDEYHRMGEAGVFVPEERVELVKGVIRQMTPKGKRHVISVSKCTEFFVLQLTGRARVFVQDPLHLDRSDSEPEPDIAILAQADPHAYGTPAAKVGLVLEVADSSLAYDREVKSSVYAEAGIADYWIVNLTDQVVEVHRDPVDGAYRSTEIAGPDNTLTPLQWPDVQVPVSELLP